MKNRVKEKIDYAAERFGFDAISNQLIEEMSELTKALCKMNRFNGLGMPPAKEISKGTSCKGSKGIFRPAAA